MTSGKQKRRLLDARRATRKRRRDRRSAWTELEWGQASAAQHRLTAVNHAALAHHNSWGYPEFVLRGYYLDQAFECACCGAAEIWRATQQKWWYEVVKGAVYSTAKYCAGCRRKRREGRWRRQDDEAVSRRSPANR